MGSSEGASVRCPALHQVGITVDTRYNRIDLSMLVPVPDPR